MMTLFPNGNYFSEQRFGVVILPHFYTFSINLFCFFKLITFHCGCSVQEMSAGCVRWLLGHTVRAVCGGGGRPGYWTPALRSTGLCERHDIVSTSWRRSAFSTEVPEETPTPAAKKKKKQDPRANASISSVGRKIPHKEIQVIDEEGEKLGLMHRADVIRIMNEKDLKLVLVRENEEPPLYQLMSGKQIHEEQLRLREKNKAKAGMKLKSL